MPMLLLIKNFKGWIVVNTILRLLFLSHISTNTVLLSPVIYLIVVCIICSNKKALQGYMITMFYSILKEILHHRLLNKLLNS